MSLFNTSFWPLAVMGVIYLGGCSVASPIQRADESKSNFEGAVYDGESSIVSKDVPESEQYRIFHRAATGFVSIQSIRVSAEQRANEFCGKQNKVMKAVKEHTSTPPHIFGNFPRIEIIFACVDKPNVTAPSAPSTFEDTRYIKLNNLKKLLDNGVLTKEEFEHEKAKILNQ